MSGGTVALLMNTVVGAGFLAAFLVIYALDRSQRAAVWFAATFSIGLLTAAVEFSVPFLPESTYFAFAIFVLTCLALCVMAVGIGCLYQTKISLFALGALFAVLFMANWLLIDTPPEMWYYGVVRQGGYAVLQGFAVWVVVAQKTKSLSDYVLIAALVFNLVQYLLRPVAAVMLGGQGDTAAQFLSTNYATALLLVHAVAMLAISFSLLMLCIGGITNRLRMVANEDQATGLLNRRGLESAVDCELAKNGTSVRSHAIIIADIDHFKAVNDVFGHHAGDAVLERFAAMLKQAAGPNNLAVRLGGEEFVMVLWNVPLDTVEMVAEGLRTAFAMDHHDAMGGATVTASFGVAYWRTDENIHTALRSADRALYRAKDRGRNRVERAPMPVQNDLLQETPISLSA